MRKSKWQYSAASFFEHFENFLQIKAVWTTLD